jgi:CRISPR/Cas system-associated exonuclease Cas4 (RecB family)
MYISYSGYNRYLGCPKDYYLGYIVKLAPPEPDNRVHMLYGEAVGQIFEAFYVQQIWTKGNVYQDLHGMVKPTLSKIIAKETQRGGVFNWKEKGLKPGTRSLEEVEVEVRETISRGLRAIKHHRLISRDAGAEVKLDQTIQGHRVGGRADFIMTRIRPHGDLVIVDGKGSRYRHEYENERQLRWYAMLYWIKTGTIPDRLGFLYWRYEPDESMDWFKVTQEELEDLRGAIVTTLEEIETAKKGLVKIRDKHNPGPLFMARPGFNCKLCSYLSICPEGQKALSKDTKTEIAESLEAGVEDGGVSF